MDVVVIARPTAELDVLPSVPAEYVEDEAKEEEEAGYAAGYTCYHCRVGYDVSGRISLEGRYTYICAAPLES